MDMYRLVVLAFVALTTAAPVAETHSVLAATDINTEEINCRTAVSNLNIESILKNFGPDAKPTIWQAMKTAAQVQCGVLTGHPKPELTHDDCEDKCGALNIESILKMFGSEDKASIWRAMKGACYGECGALFKQGVLADKASVQAAVTSSDDTQQIVTQAVGNETECQGKVAKLNIEGILKNFGQTNKRTILQAMKTAAMTQCYINANYKNYGRATLSNLASEQCKSKCGNLNIESVQKNFGVVNKQAIITMMKSACYYQCDGIYTSGADAA
jgi:hypothetical protein